MPHLDEGTLHAYLDGELSTPGETVDGLPISQAIEEHLSECADCRALLADAKAVRESAVSLFAAAGTPQIKAPPFAELMERSKAQQSAAESKRTVEVTKQKHLLKRMNSLAWAATVVLAAAVGWYARAAFMHSDEIPSMSDSESTGRLAMQVPSVEPDAAPEGVSEQEAVDPDARGGAEPETLDETTQRSTTPVLMAEETQTAIEPVARAEEIDVPAARPVEASSIRLRGVRDASDVDRSAREAPQLARAPAEEPSPPPASMQLVGMGAGTPVWTEVDVARAREILGSPVPVIDGLPISSISASAAEGVGTVKVEQALDPFTTVEILARRATVAEISAEKRGFEVGEPDQEAGIGVGNSITVQLGELSVQLSAPVTLDSLRRLRERVRRNP